MGILNQICEKLAMESDVCLKVIIDNLILNYAGDSAWMMHLRGKCIECDKRHGLWQLICQSTIGIQL